MLYDKIIKLYPTLKPEDFGSFGTIILQNDSDGRGDYIAKWDHPTLTKPTDAQLQGVA